MLNNSLLKKLISWPTVFSQYGESQYRIGIIGCGSIGTKYLKLLTSFGFDVCVYDNVAPGVKEYVESLGATFISDLDDLLDKSLLFCIVSTPPDSHEYYSQFLLQNDINTLLEKPIAHKLESAKRIFIADQASKATLFVVCNMRFHPGTALYHCASTQIGKVSHVRSVFRHRLSQMRTHNQKVFANDSSRGGGIVLDCIHEFDYLGQFFGDLEVVQSITGTIGFDEMFAEDWANVVLRAKTGIIIELSLDFISRKKIRSFCVFGENYNYEWESIGKSPENISISLVKNNFSELLFDKCELHPEHEYGAMLTQAITEFNRGEFLPIKMQKSHEAVRAFEICEKIIKGMNLD